MKELQDNIQDRLTRMAGRLGNESAPELITMMAKSAEQDSTLTIKIAISRDGPQVTLKGAWTTAFTDRVNSEPIVEVFDPRQAMMTIEGAKQ